MEDKIEKLLTERFQELAGIKPLDEMAPRVELSDEEKDYASDMLAKMHKQLNPTLDIEKSKEIMDFTIATLQEMY
jgi:hypothetical protein